MVNLFKKLRGGALMGIGYMLSPLSWWNDIFFNLPIALVFGYGLTWINLDWFLPGTIVGYWLSNVLGIVMMQFGAVDMFLAEDKRDIKRDLLIGLGGATLYTLVVSALVYFHMKENLYKVGGSLQRLRRVETLLWLGRVEEAITEFEGVKSKGAKNFQAYVGKHRNRIPNYQLYQRLGIPIGSGSVESKIKQIGTRVKISGAMWKRENVPQILRLRCAYLSNYPCLSICA
jgi:hypothetical protein